MQRDVFTAVADPTRRGILDLLRERAEVPAGEIAAGFPHVSRPAISRHLRVLRECEVVEVARKGKEQRYSLNAAPLQELHRGWLAEFTAHQLDGLRTLRSIVEADAR